MSSPAAAPSRYAYQPLEGFSSFRTLELLPAKAVNDPLHGRLRQHVNETPSFEALSYVWGQPSDGKNVIIIDDMFLPITKNLDAALRRLRQSDRPRVLWVDSICINQTNIPEKNQQVAEMSRYYQDATRVLIHLGNETNRSELVRPLLDAIHDKLVNGPAQFTMFDPLNNDPADVGLPAGDDECWMALARIFLRPWFGRYWIIQELALAVSPELICGDWSCDWEFFASAIEAAQQYVVPSLDEGGGNANLIDARMGLRNFVNLTSLRNSIVRFKLPVVQNPLSPTINWMNQTRPQSKLIDLLERCRPACATDPRDYIYAVLGMSIENDEGLFKTVKPTYEEPPSTVFTTYARLMAEWGDGINLLYSAAGGQPEEDMPSWVPNWADRDPHLRPLSPRNDGAPNYHFRAATSRDPYFRLSSLSDYAIIREISVDTIAKVGELHRRAVVPDSSSVFQRNLKVVINSALDLITFLQESYESSPAGREAIWWTLCCDIDTLAMDKAPAEIGYSYDALLKFYPALVQLSETEELDMEEEEFHALMSVAKTFLMASAPLLLEGGWHSRKAGYPLSFPGERRSVT